jgi:pimeloyl-ACP methyl ester carboxylesterase
VTAARDSVVLVPGLWMPAVEMGVLAARLLAENFSVRCFGYPSVRESATANARRLAEFALRAVPIGTEGRVHLVGHSLGGVLSLRAVGDHPALAARAGRIVLLGPPYRGSAAADSLAQLPGGKAMLGRAIAQWFGEPRPKLDDGRDIGVIAGTRSFGMARLIVRLPLPNDGVVSLAESQVPGARDLILLPVTHSGLPFSAKVAREAAGFLRSGRFTAGARRP